MPPDLVIQDELHLISGPLGTMAGLYETALDELCTRESEGKKIRPKIVASTATVRRAENQIRTLFNHPLVDVFPPPGPDRRLSPYVTAPPESERPAEYALPEGGGSVAAGSRRSAIMRVSAWSGTGRVTDCLRRRVIAKFRPPSRRLGHVGMAREAACYGSGG